ncbi:DUF4974 domain-containing protein [Bacteroides sp. AM07-16]|nr:DUF4974 domain-containing protein [Bacteroides sp. AM07-16]
MTPIYKKRSYYMEKPSKNSEIKQEKNDIVERINVFSSVDSLAENLKEDIRERTFHKINRARRHSFIFKITAAAAVVVILISLSTYFYIDNRMIPDMLVQVNAMDGEIKELFLPDSSKVVLNSGSSIEYNANFHKNRNVKLSGEAYFEVTHDKKYPFIVNCGTLDVQVYGTKFNVQSYKESLNTAVTLVEGKVGINDSERKLEQIVLKPGEQVLYNKKNNNFLKREIDTGLYTSWLDGELYFEKNNFTEIAAILSYRFNKKLIVTSDNLKQLTFTGQFKATDSLDEILHIISWDNRIKYDMRNDSVFIYEK